MDKGYSCHEDTSRVEIGTSVSFYQNQTCGRSAFVHCKYNHRSYYTPRKCLRFLFDYPDRKLQDGSARPLATSYHFLARTFPVGTPRIFPPPLASALISLTSVTGIAPFSWIFLRDASITLRRGLKHSNLLREKVWLPHYSHIVSPCRTEGWSYEWSCTFLAHRESSSSSSQVLLDNHRGDFPIILRTSPSTF